MKPSVTAKDKKQFKKDFTTVLAIALASHAKGLDQKDKQSIKECLAENRIHQVLRIIERRYSARDWKVFVEKQAQPLLKSYAKEIVKM